MPIEILMPALSPTMESGRFVRWAKNVGDAVKSGEIIAEVETDKAVMEVESADSGILHALHASEGETIIVGVPIALLRKKSESEADVAKWQASKKVDSAHTGQGKEVGAAKVETGPEPKNVESPSGPENMSKGDEGKRIKASPYARKIARELQIDLGDIKAVGSLVVARDVFDFSKSEKNAKSDAPSISISSKADKKIPLSPMRKVIAERLTLSKSTVPHFYIKRAVKCKKLVEFRELLKASTTSDKKPPTINDILVKIVAHAVTAMPQINSIWQTDHILELARVDISVAVSLQDGLITPIIFDAPAKGISQISDEIRELASRARTTGLKPHEFQGGAITISNLGMYNVDSFLAIINPPQSTIVSIGAIKTEPVVEGGVLQVGEVMKIGFSFDHRVVDGSLAAAFSEKVVQFIQNPSLILA